MPGFSRNLLSWFVSPRHSSGPGGRHDALSMAYGYRFRALGARRPRSQLFGLWAQDVHLRSPVSPLPHPRRPGGTGLQAQSLSRSPLSRAYPDQEPRDRSLDRPTPLGHRLGRLLLDRPSTVLSALGHTPDPSRTPRRLPDHAVG